MSPACFGNSNKFINKENIIKNQDFKKAAIAAVGFTGLAALAILGKSLLFNKKPIDIEQIIFKKNNLGQTFAYKDDKLFSGSIEYQKNDKITTMDFKDGMVAKSVQKAKDGNFIFGKEYKYNEYGKLVGIEKYYEVNGKPITEAAVISDKSYHLTRDNYKKYEPVVELANWKKDGDGTVVAKELTEGGKKVKITTAKLIDDGYSVSSETKDYTPFYCKAPQYKDVALQCLDDLS